jgi:DNA-binding MarR family transcriptional regulator
MPDTPAAPAAPTDLGIVDGLAQLSFRLQHELGQVAAEHGLSLIQLRLIGVLRDRTPGMQELARYLGLDKSSMTGLVDRAERRGLVQRIPAPHDGRGIQVSMTEQGHELVRLCEVGVEQRIHALTAVLTDAQRGQLSKMATILVGGPAVI